MNAEKESQESPIDKKIAEINDFFKEEESLEIIDEDDETELEPPPHILEKSQQTGQGFIGKPITNYMTNERGERIPVLGEDMALLELGDSIVIIVFGTRGSGKSYTTRVIVEEIVKENPYVATVIIDKMGVYFSLKYPNSSMNEYIGFEKIIEPMGFENNVRVFLPACDVRKVKKGTYDYVISLRPNQVPFDAWCQIFGWEIMDTQARCLKKAINDAVDRHKMENYSLQNLVEIIDGFQNYKETTKEAVRSKLDFAQDLGMFNNKGVSLSSIVQSNVISVIDVSQSGDKIATLLAAFFAEALYQTRKRVDLDLKHKEMGEVKEDLDEKEIIPPTFLVLEEFHTFMPRVKGKSVSTEGLMKYIKEGRGIGLSFIGVSQEPSLVNTTVLRQNSVTLLHNLVTDEEIKDALSVMPCPVGNRNEMRNTIKTLTNGQCIFAIKGPYKPDIVKIRPAQSIHLARSENTRTFQGIAKRKIMQRQFQILGSIKNISQLKNLDKKQIELVEEIDSLKIENEKLKQQLDATDPQVDTKKFEVEITKRDKEIERITQQLQDADTTITELEIQHNQFIEKLSSPDVEEIKILTDEINSLNQKNKELKEELKKLEEKTTKMQKLLDDSVTIINDLKSKNEVLEHVTNDLKNLETHTTTQVEDIEKLKKATQLLKQKLKEKETQLQVAIAERNAKEAENMELVVLSTKDGKKQRINELQDEIKELKNTVKERDKTIDTLNKKFQDELKIKDLDLNELKEKNRKIEFSDEEETRYIEGILDYMERHSDQNISVDMIMNALDGNPVMIKECLEKLAVKKKIKQVSNKYYTYR